MDAITWIVGAVALIAGGGLSFFLWDKALVRKKERIIKRIHLVKGRQ